MENQAQGFIGKKTGQVKASQIRGAPNYPVEHLYPCSLAEGIGWSLHPTYGLSVGIIVNLSGRISFAPVMIHRMRMKSVRLYLKMDAFTANAKFKFTLYYYDKDERIHAQESGAISAELDAFVFDIPLNHLKPEGVFACALNVDLLTQMTGDDRRAMQAAGHEDPHHPLLLRAQWLEIKA